MSPPPPHSTSAPAAAKRDSASANGPLRLGTRGSRLALSQSTWVAEQLRARGHRVELVTIRTEGDRVQDRAFAQIGQPGVFVRELERALLDGRVDLAVHSYKDLPSAMPEGLVIAAVPERVDVADRLLIRPGAHAPHADGFLPLTPGARVGTASARRTALLHHFRPDLEVGLLRGNLPRRIEKLLDGEHDAILLAAAGLERMDRDGGLDRGDLVEIRLDPERFVPAPSQGALAVQVRGASDAERAVAEIDDPVAHRAVRAERAVLARVEGGCHLAFGAYCRQPAAQNSAAQNSNGAELDVVAVLGSERRVARAEGRGIDAESLAERLVRELRDALRTAP